MSASKKKVCVVKHSLSEAELERTLAEIRCLMRKDSRRQWELAEKVQFLIGHGLKASWIATQLDRNPGYISTVLAVAKQFPPEMRSMNVSFVAHRMAHYAIKKVNGTARRLGQELPHLDPIIIRDTIQAAGIREDKRAATKIAQDEANKLRKPLAAIYEPDNRIHHASCVDVAVNFQDGSIKLVNIDPPFGQYKRRSGGHDMNPRNELLTRTNCDNNSAPDALTVTVSSIRAFAPKLAPTGVMLLWQASNGLRPEIYQAIRESGLQIEICVTWCKGQESQDGVKMTSQLGDAVSAWTYACEHCYIIKHEGGSVINHDGSRRANVIFFPREKVLGHVFQKPENLCEMFVKKHTFEGDLCVDAFGCSGSFKIAADRLIRPCHYIESNFDNFMWGSERIRTATSRRVAAA